MTPPRRTTGASPPDAAADVVRSAARSCTDLAALAVAASSCTACPELVATRTHVVVGDLPARARLLVVGEAPGAQEDLTGRPFVGASGRLLDLLLAEAGGDRADVAVLNTLKCRPPRNRLPSRLETARCRGWAERQIVLLRPRVVVALGLSASRWFLGPTTLSSVRGRAHDVGGLAVFPTYHPSAALRAGPRGEPRRLLVEDLRLAVRLVEAG